MIIDSAAPPTTEEERLLFEEALEAARQREALTPSERFIDGKRVIWHYLEGTSQERFISSPWFETLFHGTRGPGKTDSLLMSFAQHVGTGLGSAWRGVIFRQTYPQLADVQAKSEKWFRQMFPGARFNRTRMMWEFPGGEALLFRHINRVEDYWNYHGHEYPFLGWEELTNWATDECFKAMMSCCRSSTMGVPRMVRATTNPYGPGHSWVKERYQLAGDWKGLKIIEHPVDAHGNAEQPRAAIHGHIDENQILLAADPNYKRTIVASAANPEMAAAWLEGSWDIVAGGMFGDVWNARYNVVSKFSIPSTWRLDRAFDWGSSKPFSVGWYAQSDGSDLLMKDGTWRATVRGDLFRIKEWYGWNGQPNQGLKMLATDVTEGIIERELKWGLRRGNKSFVQPGPADSAIYSMENGVSIGADMAMRVRVNGVVYPGVQWTRADKRPGSRKAGWEAMRKMMRNGWPNEQGEPREKPGFFVVGEENVQFLRTVPSLPRDEKDMDDINTDVEDHIADEVRYRIRASGAITASTHTTGMF